MHAMPLKDKYNRILKAFETRLLTSELRQDSLSYQKQLTQLVEQLLEVKTEVFSNMALISHNEQLDDISTWSLWFLSMDYFLGMMISKKQAVLDDAKAIESTKNRKNEIKKEFLNKSIQLFVQFLVTLQDYKLLDDILSKKLDSFEQTFHPSLDELYSQSKDPKDLNGAYLRRQQKIELYRATKSVDEMISAIESRIGSDSDYASIDEEEVRKLYTWKLKQLSYKAFAEIEQELFEIELLKNSLTNSSESSIDAPETEVPNFNSDYTTKLETLNKPLLSKSGKVLRNFTILNKRDEVKRKVKGYGQYGPTMTVEEFLQKEFEDGRVLQGGSQVPDDDSGQDDSYTWHDIETQKAREWDDFKENNPRGSGNTMNKG